MTLAALSLCGPRHLPPPRAEAFDAAKSKDPTRTYFLRARMRRDGDKRWQLLAQTLRQALIQHDIAGMRGVGGLPHGDKTEGFGLWVREELRQKVFGLDGRWLRPYVQEAATIAQKHALQYVNGRVDPERTTTMENLAVSELRGITEAAQQQLTRAMTHAMLCNASPTRTANTLAGVIRTMRNRTRAMSEYVVAKTHATSTLSAYRDAGVTHVGVIPEGRSRFHIKQTAHGKVLVKDVGPEDEPRDPHGRWTGGGGEGVLHSKNKTPKTEGDPVRIEIIHDPSTGSKKPYEVWVHYNSNRSRRLASFKTEKSALKSVWWTHDVASFIDDAAVGYTSALTGKKASRIFATRPQRRARVAYTPTGRPFRPIAEVPSYEEVDVVTAGDSDVCPTCEEISDDGPYELDEAEDLVPAHPWCRCAFAPAGKYERDALDFDPNEPRDPQGRWTTGGGQLTFGGGAEAFVSPNINEGTFAQARSRLFSPEQTELAKASSYIDGKLGLKTENHPVLGAWADGAENSMMVTMSGVPFEQAKVASAMKGYLADQKSVLVFEPHPGGDSYMATFKATGSLEDMHSNLLKDGVAFHTLEPTQDGAMVHVFGADQETIDAVSKAAKRYGTGFTIKAGHGEFVGTTKSGGTDREQRDDAKRVYSEVVQKAAAAGQFAGHDVERVWEDVRHNWPNLEVAPQRKASGFEGSASAREEEDPSKSTERVDALRKEIEAGSGFSVRDLTPAQRQALDMYVYSSKRFNEDARAGVKTPEGDALESAINRYKTPRDLVVYRRIGWNDLNEKMKAHVGKDFTETGFMSTTMDEGMTFKPGSYMEIHAPKGASAFPVGSLSNFVGAEDEAEILFPRGSRMAVESVTPLRSQNSFKFVARMYAD